MDVDRFVADCRDAAAATGSTGVLEVVAKAVAAPSDVLRSLGEPQRAGVNVLYRSAEITVFRVAGALFGRCQQAQITGW